MSDKTFYPSFSYGFARVYMEFLFQGNGGSSSLVSTVVGVDLTCVQTITRTATGVQTVLLGVRERYPKVIYATCDVDGLTGQWGTVGTIINEGSATLPIGFTISTWAAGGGAADVVSPRPIRISLCFKNSAASNPA